MIQLGPRKFVRHNSRQQRQRSRHGSRVRLCIEPLEDRVVPSVIEDFSAGNLSAYSTILRYAPNAAVLPGAAHDGVSNALDKGDGFEWLVRNDPAVQVQQGETLSAWLQINDLDGRAYFGFGSRPNLPNNFLSTGGTLSLVAAPNSGQLLLENNSGFGHTTLAAMPANYTAGGTYRLEVVWDAGGPITGNLYDSDGVSLLSTVSATSNVYTSGGIAFRAFGSDKYFDTIEATPTTNRPSSFGHGSGAHHAPVGTHPPSGPGPAGPGPGPLDPFEYQSVPGTGRDIALAQFDGLQQFGISGTRVGLAAGNVSRNVGTAQVGWGPVVQGLLSSQIPVETPMLQQYIFRQRPGEPTTMIGNSDVKHFFLATGIDGQHLRPTESDAYVAGLNANQAFYSPQADVDPVTGTITNQGLDYFGENRTGGPRNADGLNQYAAHTYTDRIQHLLQVEITDLDPAQNPSGTLWYLAGNIFVAGDPDVTNNSRWVKIVPSFDGSHFTFAYPDGTSGHYDVRTIPGLPSQPPTIINQTPSGTVPGPVSQVEVTFSKPISVATFTPDKITSFTGPDGDIQVAGVMPADKTNTRFDITFASQSDFGNYTMVIGPDIADTEGLPMQAAYAARFAISSSLLVNGDFETGDFTGWTQSGDTSETTVGSGRPHGGIYAADLGPVTEGFLAQRFATDPGASYTLDYWLANDNGTPNSFRAMIDGVNIPGSVITNSPGFSYREFTFVFVAAGDSTELKFGFVQVPAYFHLDDVSINPAAVPGPGDGISPAIPLFVRFQGIAADGLIGRPAAALRPTRSAEEAVVIEGLDRFFASTSGIQMPDALARSSQGLDFAGNLWTPFDDADPDVRLV